MAPLSYNREQLLALRCSTPPCVKGLALPAASPALPAELWRNGRRRGCRAGRRLREKKRRFRPSLPSIIMGNVCSLFNKMDELAGLILLQREYRECSLMCFTETWLNDLTSDTVVALDGFTLARADRRAKESGKTKGGGLVVFVNERWCNPAHVIVKEQLCNEDIEFIAVGIRPYYIPREFSHVIVLNVYIPPSANAAAACELLYDTVTRLQTRHPQALLLISGDFNHASLSSTLPTFTQHVKCCTRNNKTLDLLYANVKEAYISNPLPPLGRSDHNLVHLLPVYTPIVRRQPAQKRTVKLWTDEASERLRDCFQTTDWETLCSSHGDDINSLTHCITDYINFCVENTVKTRRVRCFTNNKPWVTPELKTLLNEKRRVFASGDIEERKRVQHELRQRIRQAKDNYKKRLEGRLVNNNIRDVWRGLKTISGHGQVAGGGSVDEDLDWANELNLFFNRFDSTPMPATSPPAPSLYISSPPASVLDSTTIPRVPSLSPTLLSSQHGVGGPPHSPPLSALLLTSSQVREELRRLKVRKAVGPDGISPRVLRDCADQLSEVVTYIFNLSLSLVRVPVLWKTSCVVPVPKITHAKEPNHYRPVALTSHLMKTMERLILRHFHSVVGTGLDPLQFAYKSNIGVDDAVIYLLHRALTHLEVAGTAVRVMFFDFSSAFNTIQPEILRGKMVRAGVDEQLAAWTTDYLTNRPQYVRLRNCVSEVVVCSTGAPQGTVLSPFLFTLYTSDFTYNTGSCHLQKFSDDSAIVGCVSEGKELEYRSVIRDFMDWCETNHLCLNTSKTKEMVIDFRKKALPFTPVNIQGSDIEMVDSFKYLGVHLNHKLNWTQNTDALYKKGQSRLHLLRRLRSFGVGGFMLRTFYDSVVASALNYAVACWSSGSDERDRHRLNKLVRRASSVLGCPLDSVEEVGKRRVLAKLASIRGNASHPLHQTVEVLCSSFSGRLRHPQCRKERYRRSFIPTAVRLHNSTVLT